MYKSPRKNKQKHIKIQEKRTKKEESKKVLFNDYFLLGHLCIKKMQKSA